MESKLQCSKFSIDIDQEVDESGEVDVDISFYIEGRIDKDSIHQVYDFVEAIKSYIRLAMEK